MMQMGVLKAFVAEGTDLVACGSDGGEEYTQLMDWAATNLWANDCKQEMMRERVQNIAILQNCELQTK